MMVFYVVATFGLHWLSVRWASLMGDNLYVLSDSTAVKLTGDRRALETAIQKIHAAMSTALTPAEVDSLADYMLVPPDGNKRVVPADWDVPISAPVRGLLRNAGPLGGARIPSLQAIEKGQWVAFGDSAPGMGEARAEVPPGPVPAAAVAISSGLPAEVIYGPADRITGGHETPTPTHAMTSPGAAEPARKQSSTSATRLASDEPGMIKCSKRGAENAPDAVFCTLCMSRFKGQPHFELR